MKRKTVDESLPDSPKYPIRPGDIDTKEPFLSAFGMYETEHAASFIVGLCQSLGGWIPFSKKQIQEFYRTHETPKKIIGGTGKPGFLDKFLDKFIYGTDKFDFWGLDKFYVVKGKDGLYRVTDDFIVRCRDGAKKGRGWNEWREKEFRPFLDNQQPPD